MNWRMCISSLQETGLTVDAIAESIGVTPNAVREVIAGRTQSPRANAAMKLLALCRVRGVDLASLESPGVESGEPDLDAGRIVPMSEMP